MQLVDDPWFDKAQREKATGELVNALKYQYVVTTRFRTKSDASALHDALLLRWIQSERLRGAKNTWAITLDKSLPSVGIPAEKKWATSNAITLDALLQWISPIAVHGDPEDEFAGVFAEALKYMLLPQETFFDLRDFLMFAEMEWSCKDLPADDIEACIQYIKTNAPRLDVSNPADREKIAHEVTKFFADPGRKFKQELGTLRDELSHVQKEVKARDRQIETLKAHALTEKDNRRKDNLARSGRFRLFLVFLAFLAAETTIVYLAGKYAAGTTLFQKILNSWPFVVGVCFVSLISSWLVVGKDRILALGWPFSKLYKEGEPPADSSTQGTEKPSSSGQ